jgi:hypothetical protein
LQEKGPDSSQGPAAQPAWPAGNQLQGSTDLEPLLTSAPIRTAAAETKAEAAEAETEASTSAAAAAAEAETGAEAAGIQEQGSCEVACQTTPPASPPAAAAAVATAHALKTMCCQQLPLTNPEMQPDSSVYVQDQEKRASSSATAEAVVAVPGSVMAEAGKPAAMTPTSQQQSADQQQQQQQEQQQQQQLFSLLLSGLPPSYSEAELLPLLQQVCLCVYALHDEQQEHAHRLGWLQTLHASAAHMQLPAVCWASVVPVSQQTEAVHVLLLFEHHISITTTPWNQSMTSAKVLLWFFQTCAVLKSSVFKMCYPQHFLWKSSLPLCH